MDWSTIFPGSLFGMGGGMPAPQAAAPGAADAKGAGGMPGAASPGYAMSPQAANLMAQYGQRMLPQAPQGVPLQPIHYARAPGLLNQPY